MPFVLDASATLAWHFEDEATQAGRALARRALQEGILVPQHWLIEVANGLIKGERRHRTDPASTSRFLDQLADFSIEVDPRDILNTAPSLVPLARAHRLSVYDAAYLELAERAGLPLATGDGPLARAGRAVGLEVLAT